MSAFTPDQFAAVQKARLAHLFALTAMAFEGFQKLTELNLQAAKSTLTEGQNNLRSALDKKDLREVFAVQGNRAQPAAEKAIAYARQMYEIASNTHMELSKAAEAHYEEHNRNMQVFVDTYVKNAPAGAEAITAVLQSTVAATNSAFQSLQSLAKQSAEVAKASIDSATAAASGAAQQAASHASKQ